MNLGKLLGAGKSFFGGGRALRYRLDQLGLPKFNEGKNPFNTKLVEPVVKPVTPVSDPDAVGVSAAPVVPRAGRTANWAEKFNPFRGAQPPEPMPNVQPDLLTLNAVRVLHNDLSDAEVEVVPVRSRSAVALTPPAREMSVEPVLPVVPTA